MNEVDFFSFSSGRCIDSTISMFLILVVAFFTACHQDKNFLVLDVQKTVVSEVDITEIAEQITAIRLETNYDCVLSAIRDVRKDDSLLFILSHRVIYLFDINGNFKKVITKRGRGPGEISVSMFEIDKKNKEIIAIGDSGEQIIHYKYDGTVVKQTKFANIRDFSVFNDVFWIIVTMPPKDAQTGFYDVCLLMADKNWEVFDTIRLHTVETPAINVGTKYVSSGEYCLFLNYPNIAFEQTIRDTLYRIEGSNLIPELRINHGQYGNMQSSGYYNLTSLPIIRLSERYLIAHYITIENSQLEQYFFCYDFITEKKYHTNGGFTDNVFRTGKIQLSSIGLFSNEFFYYKWSDELSESFPERTEDDNPVLFIGTLKK